MQRALSCALVALALNIPAALANGVHNLANPAIDTAGFLRATTNAMEHRESRRVSEDEFIRLSRLPGTVILDARSRAEVRRVARQGRDQSELSRFHGRKLARLVPDTNTLILIYCNNNFANAPDPMPIKARGAALNLSTYTSLYTYGYRNVYELGPYLDVNTTRIPFEASRRR